MSEPRTGQTEPTVLRIALNCRCPGCGEGPLYRGFLNVRERCDRCGLDLGAHDSGDGPAVLLIFLLGFLVVPAALLFESAVEPPYWLHLVIWPPVILGATIGLLRPIKALFVVQQYRHRSTALHDGG